ncbi:MAG: VCBS repeat-containing protein [Saprospiraceae bacterium]|nr:VCBS repeat-containing protein [Saprospiraceae bacterium]
MPETTTARLFIPTIEPMPLRIYRLVFLWSITFCFSACHKKQSTLFTSLAPSSTGIHFSNNLKEGPEINIIEYLYFYNGAGVAAGDINNDGLPDIYLASNQHGNKLYLNKGGFQFEDITSNSKTESTGIWNTGVSMADVNGDGWLDIYVCEVGNYKGLQGRNRLYINNHDLSFTERALDFNLAVVAFSTQAAWLDYDRDGDLDMYLLCHSVHSTDTYRDTSIRRRIDPQKGDKLFKNENGRFLDVSHAAGILSSPLGYGLGIGISDFNQDGWPDILVGNDFHENDYLYLNQQNGTFLQSQTQSFGHTSTFSMGNDLADINRDGRIDIISLDMKPEDEVILKNSVGADPYDIYEYKVSFGYHYQYPRNTLQLNQYTDDQQIPYFAEIGQQVGISRTDWTWTPLLADFDNNGWLDIFVANGIAHRPNDLDYLKYTSSLASADSLPSQSLIDRMPSGEAKNYFFSQTGHLIFEDKSQAWNPEGADISTAAAYADFDNDGDLDLIINRINQKACVLRNESSRENHFVQIQLKDTGHNKFGLGARITTYQPAGIQMREIYPTRGFQSSSDYLAHFGMGTEKIIDSIQIQWADGYTQSLKDAAVDSRLVVTRNGQQWRLAKTIEAPLFHIVDAGINFIHRENEYNDFGREKLLLYKLSTQGPGCAVGDLNGDGMDDIWIGGAHDQHGLTYLQNKEGRFVALSQSSLEMHAPFEDVDGVLVDVDNDKDLDLMVASAGYQVENQLLLVDRLYINDGRGNLSYRQESMPSLPHMSSCLAPHDFDGDGDIDIFAGGRVSPFYGFNTDSYLLINDGHGNFSISDDPVTKGLGMVTDAVWADADPAPGKELIVCGEWMPITIIYRQGAQWKKRTIPNTQGIWQTIESVDLDGDGDEDLIGGNLGLNNDLVVSTEQPAKLYIGDFDQNSSPETLISYFRSGKEYSFFSKDELTGQLIYLKKRYTDYHSFASQTFDQVFPSSLQDKSFKKITGLQSRIFQNTGNGNFDPVDLPFEAQSTAVFAIAPDDFNADGLLDILLGGNLLETHPSFGRLDAGHGVLLINQGNMKFQTIPPAESGIFIDGAIRDIKRYHTHGKTSYLIVRNNNTPVIIEPR